ncbi:MAG: hypothetical protein R2690_07315 [Acidimicrobiales bacterium]
MNERITIGGSRHRRRAVFGAIAEAVRIRQATPPANRSAAAQDELMRLWIEAEVLRLTNVRASQNRRAGNPGPGGVDRQACPPRSTRRSTNCASISAPTPSSTTTTRCADPRSSGSPARFRHEPQEAARGRAPTRSRAARWRSSVTSSASAVYLLVKSSARQGPALVEGPAPVAGRGRAGVPATSCPGRDARPPVADPTGARGGLEPTRPCGP